LKNKKRFFFFFFFFSFFFFLSLLLFLPRPALSFFPLINMRSGAEESI